MTKKEKQELTELFTRFEKRIIESQAEIISSLDTLRSQITSFDRLHGEFLGLYRKLVPPEKIKKENS